MKKTIYEWVIVSTKGPDLFLTENQYKGYRDTREDGVVDFKNFSITPAFVIKTYKREATMLFKIYPCMKCACRGFLVIGQKKDKDGNWPPCPNCNATGIDTDRDPIAFDKEEDSQYE